MKDKLFEYIEECPVGSKRIRVYPERPLTEGETTVSVFIVVTTYS
jgi:hypothetical protein